MMPLVYRDKGQSQSGTIFEVVSGWLTIAHVRKDILSPMAGRQVSWRWDFSLNTGPAGFEYHGHADTLEDAKAAVLKWVSELSTRVATLPHCSVRIGTHAALATSFGRDGPLILDQQCRNTPGD
jgi:hypothetical protein